jgi:hypothetical protein
LIFGIWVYNDELLIKFTFRSGTMIFGRVMALGLKFGQIFSCHHFFSICLEILNWFLVYECIMMSYRSSLHLVLVQWILAELWTKLINIHSYTKNQYNISKHIEKKWWQLNIWPNFSPRAITRPKIIVPERNVNLICNSSLYTHIPKIKSISPSISKKSGDN